MRDKIRGRARKKPANGSFNAEAESEQPKTVSTSQLSFTYLIENFRNMAELMLKDPGYKPNEEKHSKAGLTAYITELIAINNATIEADIALDQAIAIRNKVLYGDITGVADIGKGVKAYIRSLEVGADVLKQLNTLKFSKPVQ